MKRFVRTVTLAMAFSGLFGNASALGPDQKCEASKNTVAGKFAYCRKKADAKAIKKAAAPDYAKCGGKLIDKWAKVEEKAIDKGVPCVDSISSGAIQKFTAAHTEGVSEALGGGEFPVCDVFPATGQVTAYGSGSDGDIGAGGTLSYTDNGDGTITDNNTGLMWEKKDDSGGVHDKDNVYSWSLGAPHQMNGTIVTDLLANLNDIAGGGTNCFAGYCDWRIPNARELESIADYEMNGPAADPVFHQASTCGGCSDVTLTTCSCTASLAEYWSSTTRPDTSGAAVRVYLGGGGSVLSGGKIFSKAARAVRGNRPQQTAAGNRCEADKNKIAGKYAFCRQKAEAKAIKKGTAANFAKCDQKLSEKWDKAEQKAPLKGAPCVDSVTVPAIQSFVSAHTDAVAAALSGGELPLCGSFPSTGQTAAFGEGSDGDVQAGAPLAFEDNGDGTVTDGNTGLIWEKKDDSGGVHDVDNLYTWCNDVSPMNNLCDDPSRPMDGTIVSAFLDILNDTAGGGANCFTDHCDWRIPNVRELHSIRHYGVSDPLVDPSFHQPATCTGCPDITAPTCTCTTSSARYWSSTTLRAAAETGFQVDYNLNDTTTLKASLGAARAVRGGL